MRIVGYELAAAGGDEFVDEAVGQKRHVFLVPLQARMGEHAGEYCAQRRMPRSVETHEVSRPGHLPLVLLDLLADVFAAGRERQGRDGPGDCDA